MAQQNLNKRIDSHEKSVYENILNVLNLNEADLQKLNGSFRDLKSSFNRLKIDNLDKYSKQDYQYAYLLTYFPAYSYLIGEVLNTIETTENIFFDKLSFIGSGPGPEIYGFIRYMESKGKFKPDSNISINRFDFVEKWNDTYQKIFRQLILKITPKLTPLPSISDNFQKIDFRVKLDERALNILKNSNLIVIQNMLNEIISSKVSQDNIPDWKNNLYTIIRNLKLHATLIFIEKTIYPNTKKLFEDIFNEIDKFNYMIGLKYKKFRFNENLPSIIKNYLLTGESESTEVKDIEFTSLVIKRVDEFSILDSVNEVQLKEKFPDVNFNFDKSYCKGILEAIIKPKYQNKAFVAGGFFSKFNKEGSFARIFSKEFDEYEKERGMSIFFIQKSNDDFYFQKIINGDIFPMFNLKPKLEKFGFLVMMATIGNTIVYVNLSEKMSGIEFLRSFDYESSKIFYIPKNNCEIGDIFVSNELIKGINFTQATKTKTDCLGANFTSKKRQLIQKFKGFLDNQDNQFINLYNEYIIEPMEIDN